MRQQRTTAADVHAVHRVLIVDNHPPVLRSLDAALRHRGFDVVTAGGVAEARLSVLSVAVDAVLSDC